jgi:ubiquinone/menaquinone biosynthesis C-methylase UbiE
MLVADFLADWTPRSGPLLELGSGQSVVAEALLRSSADLHGLVLTDVSRSMLSHSRRFSQAGSHLVQADAIELPFRSSSIGRAVLSLGDPFNVPELWLEVARVLRTGGQVLFTTPSHEWASSFRPQVGEPADHSEFLTRDGQRLLLPSVIVPEAQQIEMISRAGLTNRKLLHVAMSVLERESLSFKLGVLRGLEAPVVAGFVAIK